MTSCKGRFDLRNVTMLAAAESSIEDGLVMTIRGKSGPFMVSFRDVSHAAAEWVQLWASAIAPDALDASLKPSRSPALAVRFDAAYSGQVMPHLPAARCPCNRHSQKPRAALGVGRGLCAPPSRART